MKKALILTVMGIFLITTAGLVQAGEKAPQKVVDLAKDGNNTIGGVTIGIDVDQIQ